MKGSRNVDMNTARYFKAFNMPAWMGVDMLLGVLPSAEVPPCFGNKIPLAIHPCDLDSILQLCLPITGEETPKETWVPTYMAKLFIPAKGFGSTELVEVDVYDTTEQSGRRLCQSGVQAVLSNGSCDTVVLQIEGAELTMITDTTKESNAETSQSEERRLCYDLTYTPDITSLTPQQLQDYLHNPPPPPQPDPTDFLSSLRSYTATCMSFAATTIPLASIPLDKPTLSSYTPGSPTTSHPPTSSPKELSSLTTTSPQHA